MLDRNEPPERGSDHVRAISVVTDVMRNPDPKPWRWGVLPVVVLGMVLLAWVWISGLGPPEVEDTQPISTASAATISTTAPGDTESSAGEIEEDDPTTTTTTTTTTTLPPYIEVYLEILADDKEALAEVVAEIDAFDDEWVNRDIGYREAVDRLAVVYEKALTFSNSVGSHRPPDNIPGWADAHQRISDLADTVTDAVETLLASLRWPDVGQPMRGSIVVLRVAAESFCEGVDQIRELTLQGYSL